GIALNGISLALAGISQIAHCSPSFRDSIALYFVMASLVADLLTLAANSIGWFFTLSPQYQMVNRQPTVAAGFMLGPSFWLMVPSLGFSIIAGLIGTAILGCTCVENRKKRQSVYCANCQMTNQRDYYAATNEQVLRL